MCRTDNRDRYLKSRVGSTLWGCSDQWVMAPIKTAVAHKLFIAFRGGGGGGGGGGFALESFHRNKCYIRVLLLKDNTTEISYITKMGGSTVLVSTQEPITNQ